MSIKSRQTRYMVHLAISHSSQSLNSFVCCLAVVMQDQVRNRMRLLQRPAALSIARRRDANQTSDGILRAHHPLCSRVRSCPPAACCSN